jgi:hypothetical protein
MEKALQQQSADRITSMPADLPRMFAVIRLVDDPFT